MNHTQTRYWCVVPAAGIGRRMGSELPKQYLSILNRTICEHTLERLLSLSFWQQVVVCLAPEDTVFAQLPIAQQANVVTVIGGNERSDSVLNALHFLLERADESDWVLVHDVARPCVRVEDIERLITQLANSNECGGILATPVRDTMKRADPEGRIQSTVDRNGLWHALTPQMFRFGLLFDALQAARAAQVSITDEASALEWHGLQPRLIEGNPDNIKVTHPHDLALVALTLERQQHSLQEL